MPKYEVKVKITSIRDKPIVVYADDESEAEEKAVDIVLAWPNVNDVEIVKAEEV